LKKKECKNLVGERLKGFVKNTLKNVMNRLEKKAQTGFVLIDLKKKSQDRLCFNFILICNILTLI